MIDPYVWLYEFEVPRTPPTRLRLARSPVPVQWGTNSAGAVITYSPFPITHKDIREDAEGSVPSTQVIVSNITDEMQYFVQNFPLEGQPARMLYVRLADAPFGTPIREYSFRVLDLVSSEQAIAANLGNYNLVRQPFPLNTVKRNHCDYRYTKGRCGYGGVLPTCDKTEDGPNGCVAHNNEDRFGGWRSLARLTGFGS